MAQGVEYKPTEEDFQFVENALRDGVKLKSLHKALHISQATFEKHFKYLKQVRKKENDEYELESIKRSLVKSATGFFVPSKVVKIKEVFHPDSGKIVELTEITITDKFITPSVTAQIFYLGNRDAKNWKSLNNAKDEDSNTKYTDFRLVTKVVHVNKEEQK